MQTNRWVALGASFAICLAACGGDDSGSPASPCGGASGTSVVGVSGNANTSGNGGNGTAGTSLGGSGGSGGDGTGGSATGGGAGAVDASTDGRAGSGGTSQADASDANADVARDAVSEAVNDVSTDTGSDASSDAAADAAVDAGADAVADAATSDAGTDAGDGGAITTTSLVKTKGNDCYLCAVANCSDNLASLSCETISGNAAAGPATGQSKTSLCLGLLSCELTNNCGGGVNGSAGCYCGATALGACFDTGGSGACVTDEQKGLETSTPDAILGVFASTSLGGGRANQLVQCLFDNVCTSCFP